MSPAAGTAGIGHAWLRIAATLQSLTDVMVRKLLARARPATHALRR